MTAIPHDQAQTAAQARPVGSALGEVVTIIGALLILISLFALPWIGYGSLDAAYLARTSWNAAAISAIAPTPPANVASVQQYLNQFVADYWTTTYPDGLPGRFVPPTVILSVLPFALAVSAAAFAIGGLVRPPYRRINTIWIFLIGLFMLVAYYGRSISDAPDLGTLLSEARLGFWLTLAGVIALMVQIALPRPPAPPLEERHAVGAAWQRFFLSTNVIALAALGVLFLVIIDQAFGLVVYEYHLHPAEISPDRPLSELSEAELAAIMAERLGNRVKVVLRDTLSAVPPEVFTQRPLSKVLAGRQFPPEYANLMINDLELPQVADLLALNLEHGQLVDIVLDQIAQQRVVRSWRLFDSLLNYAQIEQIAAAEFPTGELAFRSWVSLDFVTSSVASNPTTAGLRTALLGSFWIVTITLMVALPLGVAAAIYLEEYASDTWWNRIIEINIRNLAGVPSIIYGLLGLAVFVRALEQFTSGRFMGMTDTNGRTVVSAAMTLALLILPVIIIASQEAIRAVPRAIREGSYGIGATKWQTVQRQVLPAALPGIMTGLILAMSRAIGETAPLVVVGASTFISIDPNGPFSKFTVVPIQIYQWTSRPEQEFKAAAGGAIIVLLLVLLLLNAAAIILRQRFSRRLQ